MALFALDGISPLLPDEPVFIAANATIVGRVRIGAGASIWFGAVLRGDTEDIVVGARSNVQDNCVLHADPGFPLTLGCDCTVGHRAILHGSTIGDGSLIGMGAVVLNGAVIGKGSIVGAHALVTEGKTFPDGVLILGSPARVVRDLDAAEIERNMDTAAHYVANGRRFLQSLRGL